MRWRKRHLTSESTLRYADSDSTAAARCERQRLIEKSLRASAHWIWVMFEGERESLSSYRSAENPAQAERRRHAEVEQIYGQLCERHATEWNELARSSF